MTVSNEMLWCTEPCRMCKTCKIVRWCFLLSKPVTLQWGTVRVSIMWVRHNISASPLTSPAATWRPMVPIPTRAVVNEVKSNVNVTMSPEDRLMFQLHRFAPIPTLHHNTHGTFSALLIRSSISNWAQFSLSDTTTSITASQERN